MSCGADRGSSNLILTFSFFVMFGTWMGIAVMTKRVPNETLALFVMFRMWMRVPELIERVPMKFL